MESGPIGQRELVSSHGPAAPLLEPVDTPLDGIALLVRLGIERGRAASGTTPPEAVLDLIGGLQDDRSDPASAEMSANGAGGVHPVRKDHFRSGSESPRPHSRDPDPIHDRRESRRVPGLTRSEVQGRSRNPAQ